MFKQIILPDTMHKNLKKMAEEKHVSVNAIIRMLLAEGLMRYEQEKRNST